MSDINLMCEELLIEHEATSSDNFSVNTLTNIKTEFEIDEELDEEFKSLSALAANYETKNVFFIGSFGIFYSHKLSQPDALQDSVCADGRFSDKRMTVLISTSAEGNDKPPVLIVTSAKTTQNFLDAGEIIVRIVQEPRSWITAANLKEHLNILDKQFQKQNRQILFIADKSIPKQINIDQNLKNIKLEFIPHSTLSPFQSGIIREIKSSYRNFSEDLETLEDSMEMIVDSWKTVPKSLIKKCCLATNLFKNLKIDDQTEAQVEPKTFDNAFEEFVNCDNFLFTHDPMSIEMENNPDTEMEFKQEFVSFRMGGDGKLASVIKTENDDSRAVEVVELSDGEDDVNEENLNLPDRVKILEKCVLICIQQNKRLRLGFIDDKETIEEIVSAASSNLNFDFPSLGIYDKWLRSFTRKNHIQFDTKPAADPMWTSEIIEKFIGQYNSEDTFFIGEFAFNYNLHPVKNSEIERKKFTVLVGVNLKGNKKLPIFVIGSENGNGAKFAPAQYISNPEANIKKNIFQKYLDSLNANSMKTGKKLLVFCEHSLVHETDPTKYSQIQLSFLSPTIVSPIDYIAIYVKYNFRQKFIKNEHHNVDIKLKDAMSYVNEAWQQLRVSVINAMLKKSGWIVKDGIEITAENQGMIHDPVVEFNYQLIDEKYETFMDFVKEDDHLMFSENESVLAVCRAIDTKPNPPPQYDFADLRKNAMFQQAQLIPSTSGALPQKRIAATPISSLPFSPALKTIKPSVITPPAPGEVIKRFNMNNLKDSPYPYHDIGVIKWIEFAKNNNIDITHLKLRAKAQKIAEVLKIKGFKASKKWLQRFKERHAVDDSFLITQSELLKEIGSFKTQDIFVFCIFSLFFKSTPSSCAARMSLDSVESADSFCGDRFTIMFCANKSGTEKLPIIVIGQRKIQDAAYLKSHRNDFKYFAHPKAIMTRTLFESQITAFDRKFQYERRKVQFIVNEVGQCAANLQKKLSNIKLFFMDAKAVKIPFAKNFVKIFKTAYRSAVIHREMLAHENGYESEEINTFESICILNEVYQKIGKSQLNAAMSNSLLDRGPEYEKTVVAFNNLNLCFDNIQDFIGFDDVAATSDN